LSAGCLPGITRELLLADARPAGIPIEERNLTVEDLYAAEAVFITSTTRILLPVLSIEQRGVRQQPDLAGDLTRAFSAYMLRYVEERRNLVASGSSSSR
jgi:branched-subunit amino acid aminotransferase/4-amino-4-deoxychorismate lyase